jgi:hypothetical protein
MQPLVSRFFSFVKRKISMTPNPTPPSDANGRRDRIVINIQVPTPNDRNSSTVGIESTVAHNSTKRSRTGSTTNRQNDSIKKPPLKRAHNQSRRSRRRQTSVDRTYVPQSRSPYANEMNDDIHLSIRPDHYVNLYNDSFTSDDPYWNHIPTKKIFVSQPEDYYDFDYPYDSYLYSYDINGRLTRRNFADHRDSPHNSQHS